MSKLSCASLSGTSRFSAARLVDGCCVCCPPHYCHNSLNKSRSTHNSPISLVSPALGSRAQVWWLCSRFDDAQNGCVRFLMMHVLLQDDARLVSCPAQGCMSTCVNSVSCAVSLPLWSALCAVCIHQSLVGQGLCELAAPGNPVYQNSPSLLCCNMELVL